MHPHPVLHAATRGAQRIVGRRRLAKLARVITNEVRLDSPNVIESNGEQLVQRLALSADHPVVFDAGAHFGEWSGSLLSLAGGADVTLHAFEPTTTSFREARSVLGARASVHQLALSHTPGTATMNIVHEGAGSNSLVDFGDPKWSTETVEQVTVSTVDQQMNELGLDRLTLLKSDVEGHDLALMRGVDDALREQRIDLVQFEYNPRWIDSRTFLAEAFELLLGHGYHVGKVTPRGIERYQAWHPELEKFVEGNYLAWTPDWDERVPQISWWGP